MKKYYVYIIEAIKTSRKNYGKLIYYTGMTNNPQRRLEEHRYGIKSNWMKLNKIIARRIVYLEQTNSYTQALEREQQIKHLSRKQKEKLIKEYKTR